MGPYFQWISLLAGSDKKDAFFAIPLMARIHLGTKATHRDRRTLFDKGLTMFDTCYQNKESFYMVADSYYSTGKVIQGIKKMGGDFIGKVRSNAVAYFPPAEDKKPKRGRKKTYGKKVWLKDFFLDGQVLNHPQPCLRRKRSRN